MLLMKLDGFSSIMWIIYIYVFATDRSPVQIFGTTVFEFWLRLWNW